MTTLVALGTLVAYGYSAFATLDAGAKKTVGLYFMYDVKQYDPAEWSSPPLQWRLGLRPATERTGG